MTGLWPVFPLSSLVSGHRVFLKSSVKYCERVRITRKGSRLLGANIFYLVMASNVENESNMKVFESEHSTIVDNDAGKGTPTQVQEAHPRDGMPKWKWATTKLVICLLSLIYGWLLHRVE